MITIFGYSAPKSDVDAVKMMRQAWGNVKNRKLEEIELVDICAENEVFESWRDFIYNSHYMYHTSFFLIPLWIDIQGEVVRQLLIN